MLINNIWERKIPHLYEIYKSKSSKKKHQWILNFDIISYVLKYHISLKETKHLFTLQYFYKLHYIQNII